MPPVNEARASWEMALADTCEPVERRDVGSTGVNRLPAIYVGAPRRKHLVTKVALQQALTRAVERLFKDTANRQVGSVGAGRSSLYCLVGREDELAGAFGATKDPELLVWKGRARQELSPYFRSWNVEPEPPIPGFEAVIGTIGFVDETLSGPNIIGFTDDAMPADIVEQAAPAPSVDQEQQALFDELADRWERETEFISLTTRMAMHPAYQRIIGMGQAAVPMILERLAQEPSQWFWALTAITGEDPAEGCDDVDSAADAWLEWGQARGLVE